MFDCLSARNCLKLKLKLDPMLGVWISLKLKEPVKMPLPAAGDESAAAAAAPLAVVYRSRSLLVITTRHHDRCSL